MHIYYAVPVSICTSKVEVTDLLIYSAFVKSVLYIVPWHPQDLIYNIKNVTIVNLSQCIFPTITPKSHFFLKIKRCKAFFKKRQYLLHG